VAKSVLPIGSLEPVSWNQLRTSLASALMHPGCYIGALAPPAAAHPDEEMRMRKRSVWIFVLSAALVVALTSVAAARWETFRVGNLVFKVEGKVSPSVLPRHKPAPSSFRARAEIATVDGSHPPAIREGVIYVDKSGELDAVGLPVCKASQLEARTTKGARQTCGDAIVGTGSGRAEIAFPEQDPIQVTSPLTLLNGGVKGGTTTLFVHAYLTVPVPAAIVTTMKFRKVHAGRYGTRGVVRVPVIAGGSGSVVGFDFKVKRFYTYKGERKSYDLSSCSDGRIHVKGEGVFKDEVGTSGNTTVAASLILPCTPKK
jgi:hypothetical protein